MGRKPNFEGVNYTIRLAKSVERKMFIELFHRLSIIEDIRNYRYVGFGSTYFVDFNLFHKNLGISNMISIEKEKQYESRVLFNKPFACIDLKFGDSSTILPRLTWNEKNIVWLDYTAPLNEKMLGDINTVISHLAPGSIFLISVNISEDEEIISVESTENEEYIDARFNLLKKRVGNAIPAEAGSMKLNLKSNKSLIRKIIDNQIKNSIRVRNTDKEILEKVSYQQLINIYYRDGADMLTVGGIILDPKVERKIPFLKFNSFDFVKTGAEAFDILVPNLSLREIHALDNLLPKNLAQAKKLPLNPEDVEKYSNIYRYFPTFAEAYL